MNKFKGFFFLISGGLVIVAAAVLILFQWGNTARFSLYGKNIDNANTALLMALSALGGITLLLMFWLVLLGIKALRRAGRQTSEQGPS